MVESSYSNTTTKPVVLVVGTLGIGKSTLGNVVAGGYYFETSSMAQGCTKAFNSWSSSGFPFTYIDSPGTNDLRFDGPKWMQAFKQSGLGGSRVDLCLLVVKSAIRPNKEDKFNLQLILQVVKKLEAKNLAFVFTFSDTSPMSFS